MLELATLAMLRLTNLRNPGRKRLCTAIVLVAVCALTVSVATRYGDFSPSGADQARIVVQKHQTWTPGTQRLLDNAATWIPPFLDSVIFQGPGYYSHVIPSGPTVSSVLLERNLYNRPPPFLV